MGPGCRIRPFAGGDTDAIVDLSLRAWEPVFESIEAALGPANFRRLHADWRSDQRQAVRDTLADRTIDVWVAEREKHIAGFVAVRLNRRRRLGEAVMVAVDPTCQNAGIGAQLIAFACDRMRDAGMTVAMVETGGDAGHAPARRTYERAGFTQLPVARYFKAL